MNDEKSGGYVCIIVMRDSGGGVLNRVRKWSAALRARGESCVITILDDRSSPYSTKATPEVFDGIPVHQISFDSCDKESETGKQLSRDPVLMNARAIVASKFHRMHAVIRELRGRGWGGVFVIVVPADWDVSYAGARRNIRLCDVAVGVSSEIATKLRSAVGSADVPVVVCPGGAEVFDLEPSERDRGVDPIRVCFVGRLDPVQKRVFDLPVMALALKDQGVRCSWTIAGDGNVKADLEQRFAEIGLLDSARFTGHIPAGDVRRLLRTQHVFVLPSAFEGQSNALCESMEAGVVPVATRVSGSGDAVDDGINGFLADVGDTASMVQHIASFSGQLDRWRLFSASARECAVTRMSTAASVGRLVDAINSAESGRRAGRVSHQDSVEEAGRTRLLESSWMPNPLTRLTRRIWRALRGRPSDLTVIR